MLKEANKKTNSKLVRDFAEVESLLSNLKTLQRLKVYSFIKQRDREIPVGDIFRASEFSRFRLFVKADDFIFYRTVSNWYDIFSHKEETISIDLSTHKFLQDHQIRLVFTYIEKDAKLNIASVDDFTQESCLSEKIGWLKRAKVELTKSCFNQNSVDINRYEFIKSVASEYKEHERKRAMINNQQDKNQRGLFE